VTVPQKANPSAIPLAGHPPAVSAETRPTAFAPTPNSVHRFAIAAIGIGLVVSAAALAGRGLSASTLLLTTLLAVLATARFGGTRAGFAVSLAGIVVATVANRSVGINYLDISLLALASAMGSLACGRYKRLEKSAAARAEAETALREKEAELQLIVDAIPALLAYVRRDQHYGLVNRTYERWFGLKPADLRGKPMQTVLGREGLAAIQRGSAV
jgi:PAS domain-containing protein